MSNAEEHKRRLLETQHLRTPRVLNPEKLIRARLDKGITTQWQMAELIGMHRTKYLVWESPTPPRRFDDTNMRNLLEILGVSWTDISDPAP